MKNRNVTRIFSLLIILMGGLFLGSCTDQIRPDVKPVFDKSASAREASIDSSSSEQFLPMAAGDPTPYRGRIQIQGNDMNPETSWPWAQNYPINKEDGITELTRLYNNLSSRQQADRSQAFERAKNYINSSPSSGRPPSRRTFQNDGVRDNTIRIDIEIISKEAFVN